ncbi:MAG: GMC oxidoreductase [Lautropia sp.]
MTRAIRGTLVIIQNPSPALALFLDTRRLDRRLLRTDVAIVGAGPAGIAIARELDAAGVQTCLLESGGHVRDEATANLYRGKSTGRRYEFADGHRSRFFGGSGNCWGGFCRPWDASAFVARDWVAHSGWPIDAATLAPFLVRANRFVGLAHDRYDPQAWFDAVRAAGGAVRRPPLDLARLEDIVSQISPAQPLGPRYADALGRARHVSVLLWANVVEIATNEAGDRVERLVVRTLTGRELAIEARQVVLAAGGIENARLLLASNRQQPGGVGNAHGLVGRFFQDHPRIIGPRIALAPEWRHAPYLDIKFNCIADELAIDGQRISGQMRLPFEVQRRERLLDAQCWLRSCYAGEGTELVRALTRMHQRQTRARSMTERLVPDLLALLREPVTTLRYTHAHLSGSRKAVRDVRLELIVEPEPDPDSRVTLSAERDTLGVPRVAIDWRLTDRMKRTVDRNVELIGAELLRAGVGRVEAGPRLVDSGWPADLEGTFHHMGTTRMHDSPEHGVVDRDCRVHGVGNLSIAGSSVFTTSSSNHPTLTLVALALRLADRLVAECRRGDAPNANAAPGAPGPAPAAATGS